MKDNEIYDEDDILDAVAKMRLTNHWCTVCGKTIKTDRQESCDHPKNGYCVLFRFQAEKDKVTHNMAAPRHEVNV